jgi:hypothetical protein
MIPDNLGAYEQWEREQERTHRRLKRIAQEWEEEEIKSERIERNSETTAGGNINKL